MPLIPRRLLTLLLAAALVAGGCSRSGDDDRSAAEATTSTTAAAPVIGVTVTGVAANGTALPDEATVAAVKQTLDAWVAAAVVAPLHSGAPAGDLSAVFTAAALERLGDPAVRASLVDEGLPPATTAITADAADAALASVAGTDGVVAVIAARVDLRIHAVGPTSDVDVAHQGDLVLVPEGDAWKIDSFTMRTSRDSRA